MKKTRQKYWFKAKKYGWGWYPSSWQGWTIMLIFTVFILAHFKAIKTSSSSDTEILLAFVPNAFIAVTILISICYVTGEQPEWRWGGKPLKKKPKRTK